MATAKIPTVMVLYTNDAVEVCYADGSRLQLSPCGSSMLHHDPPSDQPRHPLSGVPGVGRWTQFVTSQHRDKVLQALDFRNRFAERPFLCPSLLPPQDIVSLYAKIDSITWGKTVDKSQIEVLEDGSRRAVSMDEYASLVLSPHGQDFTVCYLSAISEDAVNHSSACEDETAHSSAWEDEMLKSGGGDRTDLSLLGGHRQDHPVLHSVDSQGDYFADQEHKSSLPTGLVSDGRSNREVVSGELRPSVVDRSDSRTRCSDKAADSGKAVSHFESQAHSPPQSLHNTATNTQHSTATQTQHSTAPQTQCSTAAHMNGEGTVADIDCQSSTPVLNDATLDASGVILSDGTISTPGRNVTQCDLQASTMTSVQHDISSISRVSTPDGLRGMVDCDMTLTLGSEGTTQPGLTATDVLHSSPRDEVRQVPLTATDVLPTSSCSEACQLPLPPTDFSHCSPGAQVRHSPPATDTAVQGCAGSKTSGTVPVKPTSVHSSSPIHAEAISATDGSQVISASAGSQAMGVTASSQGISGTAITAGSQAITDKTDGQRQGRGVQGLWSATQRHYTWVTQHISCSSCPAAWLHPLRLLQQTDPSDCVLVSEYQLAVPSKATRGRLGGVDRDRCVRSTVTTSLPVTCPLQHLHQWQRHDDDDKGQDNISEFKQGQLKVLMMEGVVYRFVDVANMKRVEVYPGDGSVLVSQGLTAHFFSHLLWTQGKLQEKTYSVKTLPPGMPAASYSVKKLIQRAHRLVTGCMQYTQLYNKEDLPCWKHAPMQVVEPLTPTLLEECQVPGYGRFSAFTNGRVRVVFDDRTALDMVADFSQRLHTCLQHSPVPQMEAALPISRADKFLRQQHCRLLLANGKYVTVDVSKPGTYCRYIDAGKEWIRWVQSSPKDRRQFYESRTSPGTVALSAEAELKKIECFNYIVDHTANLQVPVHGSAVTMATSSAPHNSPSVAMPTAVPSTHRQNLLPPALQSAVPQSGLPSSGYSTGRKDMLDTHTSSAGRRDVLGTQISSTGRQDMWDTCTSHTARQGILDTHTYRQQSSGTLPSNQDYRYISTSRPGSDNRYTPSVAVPGSNDYQYMADRSISGVSLGSDSRGREMMQGFQSVREALLRTSQMIQDIDDLVQHSKSS